MIEIVITRPLLNGMLAAAFDVLASSLSLGRLTMMAVTGSRDSHSLEGVFDSCPR